jgi:hypothetical protein
LGDGRCSAEQRTCYNPATKSSKNIQYNQYDI